MTSRWPSSDRKEVSVSPAKELSPAGDEGVGSGVGTGVGVGAGTGAGVGAGSAHPTSIIATKLQRTTPKNNLDLRMLAPRF